MRRINTDVTDFLLLLDIGVFLTADNDNKTTMTDILQ